MPGEAAGRWRVINVGGRAYLDNGGVQRLPLMDDDGEAQLTFEQYQRDPAKQREVERVQASYNQQDAGIQQYEAEVAQRAGDNFRRAGINPLTRQQTPYQLRPDGTIYDTASGVSYSQNMAPQAVLDGLGYGTQSTRPANAGVLPGQTAAPIANGVVQENVHGNPTQSERDLGTRSTLPGGIDRSPPAPAPAPPPPQASVQQRRGGFALPRLRVPQNVDMAGSAGNIFGAWAGAPPAQQGGFQPPPEVNVNVRDSGIPEAQPAATGGGTRFRIMSRTAGNPAAGGGGVQGRELEDIDEPVQPDAPPPPPGGGGGGGGAGGGGAGGGGGGGAPAAPPGYAYVPKYGVDRFGEPTSTWELVQDRNWRPPSTATGAPPQRAPQYASEEDRDRAAADAARQNAATSAGQLQLSKEELAYRKEKDTFDREERNARLKYEEAVNARDFTAAEFWRKQASDLGVRRQDFEERNADLSRQFQGEQAGADRALRAELGYADSRRADAALGLQRDRQGAEITGYDAEGNPTFAREQAVSSEERANLIALANVGNMAAQVRLREIDQAEQRRQFDTTTELQWRQNPSSVFDRVWGNRGGATPTAAQQGGFAPPRIVGQPEAQRQQVGGFTPPAMVASKDAAPAPSQGQQPVEARTMDGGGGGFTAPGVIRTQQREQQQQQQPQPQRSGALSWGEIREAGAEPAAIAAATRGDNPASGARWRPAGGMPVVSGQALGQLSSEERGVFDAQLRATGNNPDDYHDYRRRMTARPVRTGGFSAPRRAAAATL